jgi:DNA-binding transcriptional regulator YdaS (Cro superfamily)
MNLPTFLQTPGLNKAAFARRIGISSAMLYQFENGIRPIPTKYGAAIEVASGGQVTRQEMFPDEWESIWPELVRRRRKTGAPPATSPQPQ